MAFAIIDILLACQFYCQLCFCLRDRQLSVFDGDVVVRCDVFFTALDLHGFFAGDRARIFACFDSACAEFDVVRISFDQACFGCGFTHIDCVDRDRAACVFLRLAMACECHRSLRDRQGSCLKLFI